jgi:membrane protein implicated in regulation of membrane protease activity
MAARKLPRDPLTPKLRHFAWSIAFLLAVVSWLAPRFYLLGVAAAVVFALGTVLPWCFRWPYLVLGHSVRAILPARLTPHFSAPPHRPPRKSRKRRGMSDR